MPVSILRTWKYSLADMNDRSSGDSPPPLKGSSRVKKIGATSTLMIGPPNKSEGFVGDLDWAKKGSGTYCARTTQGPKSLTLSSILHNLPFPASRARRLPAP